MMETNALIASLVQSLAWPIAMLVALALVRKPAKGLLVLLRKVRYGPVELDFGVELDKLETEAAQLPTPPPRTDPETWAFNEYVARMAAISPTAAVSEAWKHLEAVLLDVAPALGIEARPHRVFDTLCELRRSERIAPATFHLLHELRALRNQAAHSGGQHITVEQAIEYGQLVERVAQTLEEAGRRPVHQAG